MDLTSLTNLNAVQAEHRTDLKRTTATARELLRHLPMSQHEKTALLRDRLASSEFTLCEVPIGRLAVVERRDGFDLQASAERVDAPIVVDANKRGVGRSPTGFVPGVIVVEGTSRVAVKRRAGAVTLLAWVGAAALPLLQADHQLGANELRELLQTCLNNKVSPNGGSDPLVQRKSAYITEVYPFENYFIYSYDGQQYRQPYKCDVATRKCTLKGDATPVKQKYVNASRTPAKKGGTLESAMFISGNGGGNGSGGAVGAPGSASLNYGQSGALDKMGMKACIGKRPSGLPKNPTDDLSAKWSDEARQASAQSRNKGILPPSPKGSRAPSGAVGYKPQAPYLSKNFWAGKKPANLPKNPADSLAGFGFMKPKVNRVPIGGSPSGPKPPNARMKPMGMKGVGTTPMMHPMDARPNPSPGSGAGPRVVMPHTGGITNAPRLDAESKRVAKIITKYKRALKAGEIKVPKNPADSMHAVAPPGLENMVKGLKPKVGKAAAFKIAWWHHGEQKKKAKLKAQMHTNQPSFPDNAALKAGRK